MGLSVKETVRRSLIQYPSLYREKGDVFDHLFLTIGNGYEWQNGGLVDPYKGETDDQPRWADESGDPPDSRESRRLTKLMREGRILNAKRENNQVRFVLDNFEAMFNEPVRLYRPYPGICEYSLLFHMPPDVKPDWRKACDATSHALAMWIHQQDRDTSRIDQARALNIKFRQTHFAEEDRRLRELLAPLIKDSTS